MDSLLANIIINWPVVLPLFLGTICVLILAFLIGLFRARAIIKIHALLRKQEFSKAISFAENHLLSNNADSYVSQSIIISAAVACTNIFDEKKFSIFSLKLRIRKGLKIKYYLHCLFAAYKKDKFEFLHYKELYNSIRASEKKYGFMT